MKSLIDAIRKARNVYLIGNGGSAANAIHIANDLLSCGIKATALLDISTVTAIANDHGYENIFSYQIRIHGEPGDLLIALSGSGNSPNIINAIEQAKKRKMSTFAICGGGVVANISDCILTESNMQLSEERQINLGHEVMMGLKK